MALPGAGALLLPTAVADAVLSHAVSDEPREACGLLVGAGFDVRRAVPTTNLAASPHRYEIAADEHFAAIRSARLEGLEVIGAYHSHPMTEALPSETDRDAAFPAFVFLIAGLQPQPHLRAWRLEDGNFMELLVVRS